VQLSEVLYNICKKVSSHLFSARRGIRLLRMPVSTVHEKLNGTYGPFVNLSSVSYIASLCEMLGNIFLPNMQCSMTMCTVFAFLTLFAQRVVFGPKREERREGLSIMKSFVIF